VDASGQLNAIITRGDILRALEREPSGTATVLETGMTELVVTYPDETLSDAVDKMLRSNVGRLPVVDRINSRQVLGYLGRGQVMVARMRRIEEEQIRERGWMRPA
jgi:predicted transcriptional regulator